jgi:iron complex transport system substrate-binding protein
MNNMRFGYIFFLSLLIVSGCHRKANINFSNLSGNRYAQGFSVVETPSFIKISVYDPWENAANSHFDYYLVPEGCKNDSLKTCITVPVKKVICLSTTHVSFLSALGETDKICGLSGANYVSDSVLNKRIEKGEIPDVGYDQNLNYELIVQLKPDVVFAYGVGSEIVGFVNRLKDLDIPVVLNAEYLEQSPLGKAEWIKFIAPFFDKSTVGDSIFKSVEKNYLELKNSVVNCKNRPTVMTGMPYKDQWWVPGGKAYLATMLNDAGANYLWKENNSNESFVISPEQMIVDAEKADFWIHTGVVTSLKGIESFDSRFTKFAPFINTKVYNNDLRMSPGGGNDFWESGVVHPDWILKDLISIFHPEIVEQKPLFYYRKLE